MRKLLNTLYVVSPNLHLAKDGENILIKNGKDEIGRYPINILDNVVCFTYSGLSGQIIDLCSKNGVRISVMTSNGRYIGSFDGPTKGNVLLRREQYRTADDANKSNYLSKQFVIGKLYNSLKVIQDGVKDHRDKIEKDVVNSTISALKDSIEKVDSVNTNDALRGIEGAAAKEYFKALNQLILINKKEFYIDDRNRRPPRDNVNSMLSFLYSVLMNEVSSSLESVGLDPYVGFMHTDRPGRPSLALDLMEELRPFVDRTVLNLINLKKISTDDFDYNDVYSALLNENGRKIVLNEWQNKKWSVITHDYIQERIKFGLVPFVQSSLLAKYIRGEREEYVPYLK